MNVLEHRRFRWGTRALIVMVLACGSKAGAQEQPAAPAKGSAHKLVREANELLLGDQPAEALRTYEEAQKLRPDAREIAFDQALAQYRLGEFEKAREAFQRASEGQADALAGDALYGLGTCDHAEALSAQDPKESIAKVENAMRNYQSVLSAHPDHAMAREANLKAASYWRQLKQQMQEQQQQQDQNQQNQEQNQDKQEEQSQEQQQQEQEQKQEEQNPSQQEQQSESQQQEQQQQEQDRSKEEQKKQSASQEKEKQEAQQQEQQKSESKEEESRDQAERKLREMMQSMRDRKKHRREEQTTPTYRPTEKDW